MKTESVHTLILGAGTSGLAAGHALVKAGMKPVILEKDSVPGGLFRSIRRGDFIVDIGRKELYNRIAKVDAFWSELLGSDYREYAHRGGILFNGHIIDMSPAFRGFRRGMPWSMLVGCGLDFLWSRVKPGKSAPRSMEEYFYQKRGRQLTRIAAQGFQEKLNGTKWANIPLPHDYANGADAGLFSTLKSLATRVVSEKEVNTYKGIWRHPAKGTGEICDKLAEEILKEGAPIHYKAQVIEMSCVPEDGGRKTEDTNAFSVPSPQSTVIVNQRIDTVTARIGSETICFKPLHVVSSIPPQLLKRFLYANSSDSRPSTFSVLYGILCPLSALRTEAHCRTCLPFPKRGATLSACLATGDLSKHKNRAYHELRRVQPRHGPRRKDMFVLRDVLLRTGQAA